MKRLAKTIVDLWRVYLARPYDCFPCLKTRTWIRRREYDNFKVEGLIRCPGCGTPMEPREVADDPWLRGLR